MNCLDGMLAELASVFWYVRNNSAKKCADKLSSTSGKIASSRCFP
jgi:hypothetical protein